MTLMAGVADILGATTDPTVEAEKPVESTFGWATVTSALPFRIRKDGETDELPMTPEVIGAGGFTAGARVWCQFFGLRVIVFGAAGTAGGGGGDVDSGWITVTPLGGIGGTIKRRKVGPVVEVALDVVSGTFPATSITNIVATGSLPTDWRPTVTDARGEMFGGAGRPIAVNVGVTGGLSITNHGSTAAPSISGRAIWTVP